MRLEIDTWNLKAVEKLLIREALRVTKTLKEAADLLGISVRKLESAVARYHLEEAASAHFAAEPARNKAPKKRH